MKILKIGGIIFILVLISASLFSDDYKMDVDADIKINSGNILYISRDNPLDEISLKGNLKFSFKYKDYLEASFEYKDLDELELFSSYRMNDYLSFSLSNIEPEIFLDDILPYKERDFPDSVTYEYYKEKYKDAMETVNFRIYRDSISEVPLLYFLQINLNENDLIPNFTAGLSYHFSNTLNMLGFSYTSVISIDDLNDYNGIANIYYTNHEHALCFGAEFVNGIMKPADGTPVFWTSINSEITYKIPFKEKLLITPGIRAAIHMSDIEIPEDYQLESLIGLNLSYDDWVCAKLYAGSQYDNGGVENFSPALNLEVKLSFEN